MMNVGATYLNWWGKLVGGSLGFMMGGPIGAMLGIAVGHNFDTGSVHWPGRAAPALGGKGETQTAFFNTTFRVMGHLAKRDGRVSENEIAAAQAVMTHLRLDSVQKQAAIQLFQEGKQANFNLDAVLTLFLHHCENQPQLIRRFIEIQLSTAYADGMLHPVKRERLLYICHQLRFSRLSFERLDAFIRRRYHSDDAGRYHSRQRTDGDQRPRSRADLLSEAYAILGLKREATAEEIKRAYRRLLSQYHPDKLAAKDLSPELMRKATEKTREIKAAYERIKERRGL
jgi:DnaJ like chaperone protein